MNDTHSPVITVPTRSQRVTGLLGPRVSPLSEIHPYSAQSETRVSYDTPWRYVANLAGTRYLCAVVGFIARPALPPGPPPDEWTPDEWTPEEPSGERLQGLTPWGS